MPDYNAITSGMRDELEILLGKELVFSGDDVLNYESDESPLLKRQKPDLVVKPFDTATVSRLLTWANVKRVPVTPCGARTGLSGGSVPLSGGIVLSLEKMDRILEVDQQNFVAIVEPGVTLEKLRGQLDIYGLSYPIYPGELTATIGGNLATNAGGMNAVRYGVTRHHVLGLEAVMPDGKIIHTGGKFVKSCTGYDLTQLLIGSEGTLAVITRAILKINVRPAAREVLFLPYRDLQNAIDTVPKILRLGLVPAGLEFMEKSIIEIVEKFLERKVPYHEYEAFLMITVEDQSIDDIHKYFETVADLAKQNGAVDAFIPDSERAKRRLLEAREKFYTALHRYAPLELIDAVVPRSEIARFVKHVKELALQYSIPVIAYGHAGDGNVHLHPVCFNMPETEWQRRLPDLMKDIYKVAVDFGGSISGEHGIGLAKKSYLPLQLDENYLHVLKSVKKAFDPNNIMNPGKILDI